MVPFHGVPRPRPTPPFNSVDAQPRAPTLTPRTGCSPSPIDQSQAWLSGDGFVFVDLPLARIVDQPAYPASIRHRRHRGLALQPPVYPTW
jgi:hypothetical protein